MSAWSMWSTDLVHPYEQGERAPSVCLRHTGHTEAHGHTEESPGWGAPFLANFRVRGNHALRRAAGQEITTVITVITAPRFSSYAGAVA